MIVKSIQSSKNISGKPDCTNNLSKCNKQKKTIELKPQCKLMHEWHNCTDVIFCHLPISNIDVTYNNIIFVITICLKELWLLPIDTNAITDTEPMEIIIYTRAITSTRDT